MPYSESVEIYAVPIPSTGMPVVSVASPPAIQTARPPPYRQTRGPVQYIHVHRSVPRAKCHTPEYLVGHSALDWRSTENRIGSPHWWILAGGVYGPSASD